MRKNIAIHQNESASNTWIAVKSLALMICMQVVQYLIYQGFYVNLDFHSIGVHETLTTGDTPFSGADDYTIYDVDGWIGLWCDSLFGSAPTAPQQ